MKLKINGIKELSSTTTTNTDGLNWGKLMDSSISSNPVIGSVSCWPVKYWEEYPYSGTGTWTGTTISYTNLSFFEFKDGVGTLEVDIPGVKKDKIDLTLEQGQVKVSWERKGQKYSQNYVFLADIDREKSEAELVDGVLTVTLFEKAAVNKKIVIK